MFPHTIGSEESNLTATWLKTHHLKFYIEDLRDLDDCLDCLMLSAWEAHPQRSKVKLCLECDSFH